jgi:hypothetical protein
MSDIEYPEKPFWTPLESTVQDRCRYFMFMGQVQQDGTLIFLYKHKVTRRHLNIDLNDLTYVFRVDPGRYFLIPREEALENVFQ